VDLGGGGFLWWVVFCLVFFYFGGGVGVGGFFLSFPFGWAGYALCDSATFSPSSPREPGL